MAHMTPTGYLRLSLGDFGRGLVMAVLGGILLPVSAIIQTPGFNFAAANWHAILSLGLNGAVVAFVGYLIKNLATNKEGHIAGVPVS